MSSKRKAVTAPEAPETPEEVEVVEQWQEPPVHVSARFQVIMRRRGFNGTLVAFLNSHLLGLESDEATPELITEIVGYGSGTLDASTWDDFLRIWEQ